MLYIYFIGTKSFMFRPMYTIILRNITEYCVIILQLYASFICLLRVLGLSLTKSSEPKSTTLPCVFILLKTYLCTYLPTQYSLSRASL